MTDTVGPMPVTQRRSLDDVIAPEDLFMLGVRSYEEEEVEFLRWHPEINVITAPELYRTGIDAAWLALEAHYRDYEATYITLDIDVLDPANAPGTGVPEPAGLTSQELMELVRLVVGGLPVKASITFLMEGKGRYAKLSRCLFRGKVALRH